MKKLLWMIGLMITLLWYGSSTLALTKLYETQTKQVINSGTNLTKYQRLTDKGWLTIHILDVNLKDKDTRVGILTSENGLQTFQTVKAMALKEENCIAAINADFFNGNYQRGNTIGMLMQEGKVLSSTYYENEIKDTLASFYLDEDNHAGFSYFTNHIELKNLTNQEVFAIGEINKWSTNYEYPVLYTEEWGDKSVGLTFDVAMTELVVKNGVVQEIREGQEALAIPSNGFVVTSIGNSAIQMKQLFHKGDKVSYEIQMNLDIDKIQTAISGGTMLVKNGKVAEFTHVIAGSNPRTAVGISKDGNTLFLVTVDGRQAMSIGVTQEELAEILIEKGMYQAMNLDGGGSTTMVARELGDEEVTVENSPSGGTLRMVPNAIAVFNTEKTGKLSNLVIETETVNVFTGCQKELTVKGYDAYYHPVEIDAQQIKWSYGGVKGSVKNNVFTAGEEAGTITLFASLGKAKGAITLDVLSEPNELTISPKNGVIQVGEKLEFHVRGQNKNGFYAELKNNEVEWNVEGNATMKEGVFSSKDVGTYVVSVTAGKATAYAMVTVTDQLSKVVNDFEMENFYFQHYPEEVEGSVALSTEEKWAGKYSAKLEYDFTKTDKTRASYLRFQDGIVLEKGSEVLKVNFLATNTTNDSIKAKVTDANGTVKYLLLCKGLESKGWQEVSLELKEIALPAVLTDIYVVQEKAEEQTKGAVYFDELVLVYQAAGETREGKALPKDVKGSDTDCTESVLENEEAFRVVVAPKMGEGTLLERLKKQRMEETIQNRAEMVIYPYENGEKMLANVEKTKVMGQGYRLMHQGNLSVMTLDIANGGLRATDSSQWIELQRDIASARENILVVMNGNLEDFEDEAEKQLWIDVLCDLKRTTKKNIWVIQIGENTEYSMKRGVKYLTIASRYLGGETTLEDLQALKFFEITINPNRMTYEIKNAFE